MSRLKSAYAVEEVINMSEKTAKQYTWKSLVVLIVGTLAAGAVIGFLTHKNSAF